MDHIHLLGRPLLQTSWHSYDAHGFVLGEVELDEIPPNHCAFKPPEQVPSFQATQGEKKGEKMERKREVAASGRGREGGSEKATEHKTKPGRSESEREREKEEEARRKANLFIH